jgi:DNA-binding MarR family transcriptional regulator
LADRVPEYAEELEALVPRLIRTLFPQEGSNPLTHLPMGQMRLLRVLDGECKLRVTQIAADLHMTPSAVTQMANRLEQLGLVQRLDVAEDGRGRFLSISDVGRSALEDRRRIRVGQAIQQLKNVPPEALETLISSLRRVLNEISTTHLEEHSSPSDGGDASPRSA